MEHDEIRKLISSYIDGELGPEDRKMVEAHLAECPECAEEHRQLTKFEEVMDKMTLREPPKEAWKIYTESVYNRMERGLGWILVSIGAMIILFFAGYEMLQGILRDPTIHTLLKAGILAGLAGMVILLVSLIRERVFVNKRERYKEIEK
jgi:predicted anti-sigma-YlaC factor YlaD